MLSYLEFFVKVYVKSVWRSDSVTMTDAVFDASSAFSSQRACLIKSLLSMSGEVSLLFSNSRLTSNSPKLRMHIRSCSTVLKVYGVNNIQDIIPSTSTTTISMMRARAQTPQKTRFGLKRLWLPLLISFKMIYSCNVQLQTQRKTVREKLEQPFNQQALEVYDRMRCRNRSPINRSMAANLIHTTRGIVASRFSASLSSFNTLRMKNTPKRILKTILYASCAYRKSIGLLSDMSIQKQYNLHDSNNCSQFHQSLLIIMLSPKRKILNRYKIINNRPLPIITQPSEDDKTNDTLPFKPFQKQFRRISTQQSSPPTFKTSAISSIGNSQEVAQNRVCTQAQTNDLYEDDFQSLSDSLVSAQKIVNELVVQEQNQNVALEPSQQKKKQAQSLHEKYEFYSVSYLNRCNQKLVKQIQFLRRSLQNYKINSSLLRQQQNELHQLRLMRQRAINFAYELKLDRQTNNRTQLSKSAVREVNRASNLFKKQRYKSVKEGFRRANPTDFEMQFKDQMSIDKYQRQLQMARQELLSKKRQYYAHEQEIKELTKKLQGYVELMDLYQSRLSVGDSQSLQNRRQMLNNEIKEKKMKFESLQIEMNLEISQMNNELSSLEIHEIQMINLNKNIKQEINSLQRSLLQTPKANKESLRFRNIIKQLQNNRKIQQRAETTRPKAISRFFYNPQKNRNSSFVRIPED